MDLGIVILLSALLLSLERLCYAWAWMQPNSFLELCAAPMRPAGFEPTEVLEGLFYLFKVIQACVFAYWCLRFGHGQLWPIEAPAPILVVGGLLILVGQALNVSVFRRLGKTGVFYGVRFGYQVPWVEGFPFSLLKHPQYVGTVLSIWGFFMIMRFPNDDWIVLPALETLYYALGARCES